MKTSTQQSAFHAFGLNKTIETLIDEICSVYQSDEIPWVVGYSGGKDSTAVLQLVWMALSKLPKSQHHKKVYVISTDTLVENPVVAAWVDHSLGIMKHAAETQQLPVHPNKLTPAINDTFWVNLIGRGYPAPRHKFRWCTERLKIKPSNQFISDVVKDNGEAIVVLGTRKAESSRRASTMNKYEDQRTRDKLSPNASLPNSLVYSPIENWTNDDVWTFLMQEENKWGIDNNDLLTMYQGATADGECPLVVDTSTPSCGNSRFGCWVCTMVEQDKSMSAMIQNDQEKEWMLPLLELRNELDLADDRHLRDFRRMSGRVQLYYDRTIPGPYLQKTRHMWLKKVLEAQVWIRKHGPKNVGDINLITMEELHEIRRIWVIDKHEFEDTLPGIYHEVTGEDFPAKNFDDGFGLNAKDMEILKDLCGEDELHYELIRELLDIEYRYKTMARRAGLFDSLEKAFERHFYDDQNDALLRARRKQTQLEAAREGRYEPQLTLALNNKN